jgi:hypothetical protein
MEKKTISEPTVVLSLDYINRVFQALRHSKRNLYESNLTNYNLGLSNDIDNHLSMIDEVLKGLRIIVNDPQSFYLKK